MMTRKTKQKKAQVSTTDMLIAIIIFVTLVTFIILGWHNYNEMLLARLENEVAVSKAIEITDHFVKTPGIPTSWNRTNVELIGLASSDRKISEEKVQEFCNISYYEARQLLNLAYQFYFSIEETECGLAPSEKAKKVVSLTRPVIYRNESTLLKLSLWR